MLRINLHRSGTIMSYISGVLHRSFVMEHGAIKDASLCKTLISGKYGSGLTLMALSRALRLLDEIPDRSSVLLLSNQAYERSRVQESIDLLAPLSSVEAEVHSIHSLIRAVLTDHPSILGEDPYRLINDREQLVVFETNRDIFLPTNSLQYSYTNQTRSVLSNINTLKSSGVSPSDFSSLLSLYRPQMEDHLFKKYSDFGRIYALFDQYLKDHRFYTINDVIIELTKNDLFPDLFLRRFSHFFLFSIERNSPIQNQLLAALIQNNQCQSAFLTHHTSITPSDHSNPESFFREAVDIKHVEGGCLMSDYISLLDQRMNGPRITSVNTTDTKEMPKKPSVCRWDEAGKDYSVHVSEFYSPLEEQEEIVSQIKKILATPLSMKPPSANRVENLYRENRVENKPMNHVVGVFFKTQKEVIQFCDQLKQAGIPYRGNEEVSNFSEGFNILHLLFDPNDSRSYDMMSVLQLPSLHLSTQSLQEIIQLSRKNHLSLYSATQNALNSGSFLSKEEWSSLSRLLSTISSLHSQTLRYPGSYLLYQFYRSIEEMPHIMEDSNRQASLLNLLNELMYLEDGHSPLLQISSPTSFLKLHDYIDYLQYLPMFPSTSIVERINNLQGHPLTKLLLSQKEVLPKEDEETDLKQDVVLVGTYSDIFPNYFTSLFLPQLNASRLPLYRSQSACPLPEFSVMTDSSSPQPFIPTSRDLQRIQQILSRTLSAPYLSYSLYSTTGRLRATKPSIILSSLLSSAPRSSRPASFASPSSLSDKTMDYSSFLTETDESGESRILLSVSRMNKYFQCPHAFYFHYILNLQGLPAPFLSYGAAIHGCIEDFSTLLYNPELRRLYSTQLSPNPTDANIRALLNSEINQERVAALLKKYQAMGESPDESDVTRAVLRHYWKESEYGSPAVEKSMKLNYFHGVMDYLRREIRHYFDDPKAVPISVESDFVIDGSVKIDGREEKYRLKGIFDRIEGKDGKPDTIVDYKSNPSNKVIDAKSFEATVKGYYSLQAACYIDAFERMYGYPPSKMRFESIETGVTYEVDVKKVNKAIINSSIIKFVKGIRSGDFSRCDNDFQCSRCEYRNMC